MSKRFPSTIRDLNSNQKNLKVCGSVGQSHTKQPDPYIIFQRVNDKNQQMNTMENDGEAFCELWPPAITELSTELYTLMNLLPGSPELM